jgi:hypothetical protein
MCPHRGRTAAHPVRLGPKAHYDEFGMEESAEQILRRLARYRDSLEAAKRPGNRRETSVTPDAARASVSLTRSSIVAARQRLQNASQWDPAAAARFVRAAGRGPSGDLLPGRRPVAVLLGLPDVSRRWSVVACALAGQGAVVIGFVVGVGLYVLAGRAFASGAVLGLAALAVIAVVRRVPFVIWCLTGLIVGAAIGFLS